MKTLAINKNTSIKHNTNTVLIDNQKQVPDLEIISNSFNTETGQTYLIVSTQLLMRDNYKLFVRGNHLGLVISEHIEFNRPVSMKHYSWKNYDQESYDRLHSVGVLLPWYNYYIIDHFFNSEKKQLEIVLGSTSVN